MSDEDYLKVADITDIARGKTLCVTVNGREILLCHSSEGLYAVDNLCTHAAARLCDGKLKGHRILCPLHGAAFDVRDGQALSRPATQPLRSYAVKLENNSVMLAIGD